MGLNKALAFSCMLLALACAGVAKADTFSAGQFVTYLQAEWGADGVAASLLAADFNSVYASSSDELFVGVVGTPGQYFLEFTSYAAVQDYLPAAGNPATLPASYLNPGTTASGEFGGDVTALELDVAFSNAGFLKGTSSIPFGDLLLTNFSGGLSGLNGQTVNQFLNLAEVCLGGGSCPYGAGSVDGIAADLTISFVDGTVYTFPGSSTPWADIYLALPSSGTPTPEPSSLLLLAPALAGLAFLRRRRSQRIQYPEEEDRHGLE